VVSQYLQCISNNFIPSIFYCANQCSQYGLDRVVWLILKKSEFTFDGNGCNKIGMSNAFFVSWLSGDEQRCYEPIESCLRNDIRAKIRVRNTSLLMIIFFKYYIVYVFLSFLSLCCHYVVVEVFS
jgi:hypothetical protein